MQSWDEAEMHIGERGLFRAVFTASMSYSGSQWGALAIDDISFLTCPGEITTLFSFDIV